MIQCCQAAVGVVDTPTQTKALEKVQAVIQIIIETDDHPGRAMIRQKPHPLVRIVPQKMI